jgi:hypothetical protein
MIVAARRREFHIAISRTGDNLGARSLLSEPKRLVFERDVSVELLFARILDGFAYAHPLFWLPIPLSVAPVCVDLTTRCGETF